MDHTQDEFVQRVLSGKPNKMPSFREKLTDEQIAAAVKFVREELQKGATPNQGQKHVH